MRTTILSTLILAAALAPATPVRAQNCVLDWNNEVLNATRLSRNPPPMAALHMATFQVAIFDAVNGITGTHQGWLVNDPAPAGASIEAAAAGAAHTVLKAVWAPIANETNFDLALQRALAAIPDGPGKTAGLEWGRAVATRILAKRATSGFDKPIAGPFSSQEPGKWRETPPGFRPPVLPHISRVTPFAMTSPEQFRAPPPPAVGSKEHAEELAYVVRVGARDGAERTEYETMTAPFWSDDLGTATPPGHWNVIAQDIARSRKLSVPECARLFALLTIANADAGISCWDTKFYYRTWRPESGIRELTAAANAHAQPRPDFIPLMVSPAFPDYTSGHSTFSAAASRLLERYFGTDDIEFTTTSDGLPGAVRSYKRLSDCRREIGMSRVWAGIHVMSSNLAGQEAGLKIADWVFDHALPPRGATPRP